MRARALAAPSALAMALCACAGPGFLSAPPGPPGPPPCGLGSPAEALARCAPLILQERAPGLAAPLDRPLPLDFDGSGTLGDDHNAGVRARAELGPFYASADSDAERLYLFYGLYYAADWSGDPRDPRIDHPGDFEGALLVVKRATGHVEAVITQAHRRFYLWAPAGRAASRAASGGLALSEAGRPLLFCEAGGHGLYAFGSGAWRPRGGTRYPGGTAAVTTDRFDLAVRPLDALRAFTSGARGGFRELPRGATPPWLWQDRDHPDEAPRGAIVFDPARLYAALRERRR